MYAGGRLGSRVTEPCSYLKVLVSAVGGEWSVRAEVDLGFRVVFEGELLGHVFSELVSG